jgi:hypothetical protein
VYGLTAPFYVNNQTFYGPTATFSNTLLPGLYTNEQTFYAASVLRGAVTIAPQLLTNTQVFYGPVVASSNAILPPLLVNSQVFYDAEISGGEGSQIKIYYNIGMFGIGPLNG